MPGIVRFGRIDAPRALDALAAAVRRVSAVRRGTLTAARNSRTYEIASAAGAFSATLRFPTSAVVTFTLFAADDGTVLARRTGHSPLRIVQPVRGPVRVEVRTKTRALVRYALTVTYGSAAG